MKLYNINTYMYMFRLNSSNQKVETSIYLDFLFFEFVGQDIADI